VGKLPQPDMTNVAVFMPRPVVDPETGEALGPGSLTLLLAFDGGQHRAAA
jgi:hypothetical protein